MAVPEYALITGKTIAGVKLIRETFDDAGMVLIKPTIVRLRCTDGRVLKLTAAGAPQSDGYRWMRCDWKPAPKPKAKAAPRKPVAKKEAR